jgi:acylphosphatase
VPQAAFSATVSGRVQMVMFRDFTARRAKRLNIVGEVMNAPDGTVRITAEGTKEDLETLLTLLKKGPLLADVSDVSVTWREPTGGFESFSIRYP